jgi:hypothetical protein
VVGSCEHCDELSGSISWGELPDQLRNSQLFKEDSDLWTVLVISFL